MIDAVGFMSEIPVIKNNILSRLLNDEILMKLVADTADIKLPALQLRYKQVFPYLYTIETTTDAKTFIIFDTYVESHKDFSSRQHPGIVDVTIEVFAVCHDSLSMVDDAVAKRLGFTDENLRGYRVDLMCMRIDELLNGTELSSFGKFVFDEQTILDPLATDYHGKCSVYTALNANRYGGAL